MRTCDLCGGREGGVQICTLNLGRIRFDTDGKIEYDENYDLCLRCRKELAAAWDQAMQRLKVVANVQP